MTDHSPSEGTTPTPETPVEQRLIELLNRQASDNGCYCEVNIDPEEAGIPLEERCPYCLMGKAAAALASQREEIANLKARAINAESAFNFEREKHDEEAYEDMRVAKEAAESRLAEQTATVERLRQYAEHHADCAVDRWMDVGVMHRPRPDCTCGLDAALKERTEP